MWIFAKFNELIKALTLNTAATDASTQAQEAADSTTRRNTIALLQTTEALNRLSRLVRKLIDKLTFVPKPGPVSFHVTQEDGNMLVFTVSLPAEPEGFNDIASGELTVTIEGSAPAVMPTAKGATEVPGLKGAQGATLALSFVYIDDAGNRSEASKLEGVVLSDTLPPATPGALAITVTGEEADPT